MRFVLFVLAFCISAFPALAELGDCDALYKAKPKSVAGLKLTNDVGLDRKDPGAGFALEFGKRHKSWASVYFFDSGRRAPSEAFAREEYARSTKTALEVALAMYLDQGASEIGQYGPVIMDFPTGPKGRPYYKSTMSLYAGGLPDVHNYLFLARVNKCLVKLRITKTGSKAAADKMFERAEKEFVTRYQR